MAGGARTADEVTAALSAWRQGDAALEVDWFFHVADPACPLTEAAKSLAAEGGKGTQVLETETTGVVVLTQTCDIVRDCRDRPFLEVSPLVAVAPHVLAEIAKGRRPGYLFLPGIADRGLVGDLDRVMTIEKTVAAGWERTPGARGDAEARRIADALSRKRKRFAFPDDFTALAKRLQDRLIEKHGKASPEGEALRAVDEIRVTAAPFWDAAEVSLFFHFIRADAAGDAFDWPDQLAKWLKLLPATGRFVSIEGVVTTLSAMRADEYAASDPLDLDHLSASAPAP